MGLQPPSLHLKRLTVKNVLSENQLQISRNRRRSRGEWIATMETLPMKTCSLLDCPQKCRTTTRQIVAFHKTFSPSEHAIRMIDYELGWDAPAIFFRKRYCPLCLSTTHRSLLLPAREHGQKWDKETCFSSPRPWIPSATPCKSCLNAFRYNQRLGWARAVLLSIIHIVIIQLALKLLQVSFWYEPFFWKKKKSGEGRRFDRGWLSECKRLTRTSFAVAFR